jgi:hypothetical protein
MAESAVVAELRRRGRGPAAWRVASWSGAAALCLVALAAAPGAAAESAPGSQPPTTATPAAQPPLWVAPTEADVHRYRELVTTLASEEMEGRGPGTKGIDLARDYIAERFDKAGLKPVCKSADAKAEPPIQLSFFEPFDTRIGTKVKEARLTATGSGGAAREFQRDQDYTVMGFSAQATVQGEAVFVGYGVKNEQRKYHSYAADGQAVAKDALQGRIAVCFRYEPMNAEGQSLWGQKGSWQAAQLTDKAALAAAHGAKALLYVNPPARQQEGLKSTATSGGPAAPIPVMQISLDAFKALLAQAGRPADDQQLRQLQQDADEGRTGLQPLTGVTLSVTVQLEAVSAPLYNVTAVLPGAGPLADQYVTIGAHYDHLGFTGDTEKRIYFGADDNASGTSGLVLLAERFGRRAREKDGLPAVRRSLLFVAFSGEERGLVGSRHLVNHLDDVGLKADQIAAMLNLDMIGRMVGDRLMVGGVGSGDRWDPLVDAAMRDSGLTVQRTASGSGPSDHASFYGAKIPVLFFLGGMHSDIHSPRDTVDKINCEGAVKIANLVDGITQQLLIDPARLAYVAPKPGQEGIAAFLRGAAFLGIRPEPAGNTAKGVKVGDLVPDSPAAKAGLQAGDVIQKLGTAAVASVSELLSLLTKQKPGDKVKITVTRGEQSLEVDVTLGKP